MSLDYHVLYVI